MSDAVDTLQDEEQDEAQVEPESEQPMQFLPQLSEPPGAATEAEEVPEEPSIEPGPPERPWKESLLIRFGHLLCGFRR